MYPKRYPKAVIFVIEGSELKNDEFDFFRSVNPFGFILFSRNCINRNQIYSLTSELRSCVGRPNAPILIDQEGGRVTRLPKNLFPSPPSQGQIGTQAEKLPPEMIERFAWLYGFLIGYDLHSLGINVNCAPLLDLCFNKKSKIIGDRSFGSKPHLVTLLGKSYIKGLNAAGVNEVIKHIPGHGRSSIDSHFKLPIINTPIQKLYETDFKPFKNLCFSSYAMTAHVRYATIDKLPVTFSEKIIQEIIREYIGFKGLLITDDISMGALKGNLSKRAELALNAGCDLVLHCSGDISEMYKIARILPEFKSSFANKTIISNIRKDKKTININILRDEFKLMLHKY
ncbi:MAG: beta-N-acetylhexosaminidase [Rhodospirillaceae bacterium]|nr:beta-N-acetylhexosaminidase [Rhodospirillaceae bacterium]